MQEIFIEVFTFLIPPMIVNGSLNFLHPLRKNSEFFAKLDKPIDGHKNFFDGKRILGESTTFPGIIVVIIIGPAIGYLIYNSLFLGLIVGICTYLGHASGSFLKRRINIPDGKFLPIIDHGDYIIFTGLVWLAMGLISFKIFLISWVTILIIHPIFCYLGYKLGIRSEIL
jgi:CDP-2,3-bis-(O-geranylgeranyl)-sn-glycerol synthase